MKGPVHGSADETRYRKLMAVSDLSALGTKRALKAMGQLVDVARRFGRIEGLERAKDQLSSLLAGELTPAQDSEAHYFLANAWASLRRIKREASDLVWEWEQEEIEKEITNLRLAAQGPRESGIPGERLHEIWTNLGNTMSEVGRFVDAIDYWDKALLMSPGFGMAVGNRGFGLVHYAGVLYDPGQARVLIKCAHRFLTQALKGPLNRDAREAFQRYVNDIESRPNAEFLREPMDLDGFCLGRSRSEKSYREWCLNQRLFLNPLNDLGPYRIAARDILTCPSVVMPINRGPYYHGFFNQMKQEFVSARFLFYEGLEAKKAHYSDRDVLLYNTLDYPAYGLHVEKQKLAFRAAYSVLDKVAFFLNHYMRLSIPKRSVSFRKLWYEKSSKLGRELRGQFAGLRNWPLRGLFWLSKDLYEDAPGFRQAMEPEAKGLAQLRNLLEHRYVKIHDELWPGPPDSSNRVALALSDTLAHSVYRGDFAQKALKMLRLARAALIYLSLGIHIQERQRAADRDKKEIVPPRFLEKWEDEWKI